jgi:hypothetical protein
MADQQNQELDHVSESWDRNIKLRNDLASRAGKPNNLEIKPLDAPKQLMGSAVSSVGTGIKELSLGDVARAGETVQKGSMLSEGVNWLAGKAADTFLSPEDAAQAKMAAAVATGLADGANVNGSSSDTNKSINTVADAADVVIEPVAQAVGGAIKGGGDWVKDSVSDQGKEAMNRQFFTEDKGGSLHAGDAWTTDPAVWAMKMSDVIGTVGGTLVVGGAVKGGVKAAVTRSMLKRRAPEAYAAQVAELTAQRIGEKAAFSTGAAMSVGQTADQTRESVKSLSFEELMNSDSFKQNVQLVNQDPQYQSLSSSDRLDLARQRTADMAADYAKSDPTTYAAAAAGTVLGDAMLFKMITGKAGASAVTGNLLSRAGKGFAKGGLGEGVGEAAEEGAQQNIQNRSDNAIAGTNIDPMQGVKQSAAEAGFLGVMSGGGIGAGSSVVHGSNNPTQTSDGAEQTGDFSPDLQSAAESSPEDAANNSQPTDDSLSIPAYQRQGDISPELQAATQQAQNNQQQFKQNMAAEENGVLAPIEKSVTGNPDDPAFLRTQQNNPTGRDTSALQDANPYTEAQSALAAGGAPTAEDLIQQSIQQGNQGKTPQESGVTGDLLLASEPAGVPATTEQSGTTIDGQSNEIIPESRGLDYKNQINMPGQPGNGVNDNYVPPVTKARATADKSLDAESTRDPRSLVAQSIERAGSESASIFDQLKTIRVTKRGKPFGSEKEAQLASRKTETPIALPTGGFGVVDKTELEQVQASQNQQLIATPQADVNDTNVADINQAADLVDVNELTSNQDVAQNQQDINVNEQPVSQTTVKQNEAASDNAIVDASRDDNEQAYGGLQKAVNDGLLTSKQADAVIQRSIEVAKAHKDRSVAGDYINEAVSRMRGERSGSDRTASTIELYERGNRVNINNAGKYNPDDAISQLGKPVIAAQPIADQTEAKLSHEADATQKPATEAKPELPWTGYKEKPDGTMLLEGDRAQLSEWAKANNVLTIKSKSGVIVGKKSTPIVKDIIAKNSIDSQSPEATTQNASPQVVAQNQPDINVNESSNGQAIARDEHVYRGSNIDDEWVSFSDKSGSLKIPRSEMPQIKTADRGAMVNFLNARGVSHQEETIPSTELKPTQAEFSSNKVESAKQADSDRAVLVSSDGYVIDGHHQWIAKRDSSSDVRAIRLNAPAKELIPLLHEFPSSKVDTSTALMPNNEQDQLVGQDSVAVVSNGDRGVENSAPVALQEEALVVATKQELPWTGFKDKLDGTMILEGDPIALKAWAKDNDITAIKSKTGVVVGKGSVPAVKDFISKQQETGNVTSNGQLSTVPGTSDVTASNNTGGGATVGELVTGEQSGNANSAITDTNNAEASVVEPGRIGSDNALTNQLATTRKATSTEKGKISDFGEKIGGARKDVWQSIKDGMNGNTSEEVEALPLSKAWPEPNYRNLLDNGMDGWAVSFIRSARESIPAKPKTPSKLSSWAKQVTVLRDLSVQIAEGNISPLSLKDKISSVGIRGRYMDGLLGKADLYHAVGHKNSLGDLTVEQGQYSIFYGEKFNPPKTIWSVQRTAKSKSFGSWPMMIASAETKEQAIDQFKKMYEVKPDIGKVQPKETTFEIFSKSDGAGFYVGKKIGRNPALLSGPFKTIKEARAYKDENQNELTDKLEQFKKIPNERKDSNNPRVGEDMRGGEDVTTDMFAGTFGFRGVEFGNWVEQDRRQSDLNRAYDALMDLAAIIGVPPKALSLNGQLGIAFGARGAGGIGAAAAHYEPGNVVINLTKKSGAGSLGHEWWHALDNYFSRMRNQDGMLTTARDVSLSARGSDYFYSGAVRKEMVDSFGAVVGAIENTAIKARSSKLDAKRSKDYWTTKEEMSARAFESYLISKLQDQNASNDYLANIVSNETWSAAESLGFELDSSYPYPTAGEIPAIRGAFDRFFSVIDYKTEGNGNVALFSKSSFEKNKDEESGNGMTKPEAAMVAKQWLRQFKTDINVEVVRDQTEFESALADRGFANSIQSGEMDNAAYLPDSKTILINASAIQNSSRLRQIMRHEILVHHGLRYVVGEDAYVKIMNAIAKGYETSPAIRSAVDTVTKNYADKDMFTQMEEAFAHYAENRPADSGPAGRMWQRIVGMVKSALQKVNFISQNESEQHLDEVLHAIAKNMRNGIENGVLAPKTENAMFSHGSETDPFKPNKEDVDNYRTQLEKGMRSQRSGEIMIDIGSTPEVLKAVGAPDLILRISRDTIRKAVNGVKHDVPMNVIEKLPELLHDPISVFDSKTHPGDSLVVLLDAADKSGRSVVSAIQLKVVAGKYLDINRIASIHGRPEAQINQWLSDGLTRYIKENHLNSLRTGLQLPLGSSMGGHNFSVLTDADIRKRNDAMLSRSSPADDALMNKLGLGPKQDVIDKTKERINKLKQADRTKVKSWIDETIKKANTQILDALAPIKYAEDASGKVDASDSGYVAARLASGSATVMNATMLHGLPVWKDGVIQRKNGTGEADSLLGIFESLGSDLHNWLGWMAGHRGEILLAEGRENLLTQEDIAALKAKGNGKEIKFESARKKWNALNKAVLDLAEEAGLFTAEERSAWDSEWYVPFFRETEDGDVTGPYKHKGIANQTAGIKKLKGGTANVNDILQNIFTTTSKTIDAAMKNMAAQKVVHNLAETDLIEVLTKPNLMDIKAAVKNQNDMMIVKLEGEDYLIRVNDKDLFNAMTMIDQKVERGAVRRLAMKAKHILTAGVTASPDFMLRNFLRDAASTWAINEDGFKPMIDSIRGMKKAWKMDDSSIDMMFSGASFMGGNLRGNDPEAMASAVRKALRRKGMSPEQVDRYEKTIVRNGKQAMDAIGKYWEKYERVGEAVENGSREAVYEAAIKAGKTHAQAAFEAKDLMDFSMMGASKLMQVFVDVLPFFNARMQGLGKLGRAIKANPKQIAKRGGMIAGASLALLALNWDDERYEDLPDWDKDLNWHFWLGDQHLRIPKPFEIGLMFGTLPERMARTMGGKDTAGKFGKVVARNMLETFAINPIPQVVKPLTEAYFNYDPFRGGPIESMSDMNVNPEARYDERTSLMMRELGELTGMSPKKLEHIVSGYTGTMGGYVMAMGDSLVRMMGDYGASPALRADQIPILKSVYQGSAPAKSTQAMQDFYRMVDEANQVYDTILQYRKEGRIDEASALLEENKTKLAGRKTLNKAQLQFRALRNEMSLIQRDKLLNSEQKRDRLDRLLKRRNDFAAQLIQRFE